MAPSRWQNFRMWRGRLPHWRADNVLYFVTFRHRRPLNAEERGRLFDALRRPEGRAWNLLVVGVRPEQSDLIAALATPSDPSSDKLTAVVERAKIRAGRVITKASGKRFPPFYGESYDRILRDEGERDAYAAEIIQGAEDSATTDTLWVTPPSTDPGP